MLVIRHDDVRSALAGRERGVLDAVRTAYRLHDQGRSVVPHSVFVRLGEDPDDPAAANRAGNRFIGLPAYLSGDVATVGLKWIASFPGNLQRGLERASAVVVLNSLETGHPEVLVEASLISAARTAASAALAADLFLPADSELGAGGGVTVVGCGVINLAVVRYLAVTRPGLRRVTLFDRDRSRAGAFARRVSEAAPGLAVAVADDRGQALAAHSLISIATTAPAPYLDLSACRPGSTVLHISLRDLFPQTILASHNVVDDADHVCREGTSLELAERLAGDRGFIDAALGALLRGGERLRRDPGRAVVFSPFGLGALDVAVARVVWEETLRRGGGVRVDGFLPASGTAVVAARDGGLPTG